MKNRKAEPKSACQNRKKRTEQKKAPELSLAPLFLVSATRNITTGKCADHDATNNGDDHAMELPSGNGGDHDATSNDSEPVQLPRIAHL